MAKTARAAVQRGATDRPFAPASCDCLASGRALTDDRRTTDHDERKQQTDVPDDGALVYRLFDHSR